MTLQEQAQHALAARDSGDPRWDMLVLFLSLRLFMPPEHVVFRIERLAATGIA